MANATGFLLRTSLSDTGSLPRTGSWTGCPDIIPAGTTAIARNELISSYGSVTDKPLTQGLTNFMYLRAKNMNSTPLTQKAFMFQVPGSLVLHPENWYNQKHALTFSSKVNGQIVEQNWQTMSADAGQVAVTDAFTWAPDDTEHHCLVGVVADSWNDVFANFPNGVNTMDDLARWIYSNPSSGWHNITIKPLTSRVYESSIPYAHSKAEEKVTFTIVAENVPVGAKVSFSSNTATASGQVIGQDWTTVSAPPNGAPINPDFEVGSTITVEAGYKTIITYRTDFNGLAIPANFKMHMKATVATTPAAAPNTFMAAALQADSLHRSFHRSFSANAIFTDSSGQVMGKGLAGYRAMHAGLPFDDDPGDLEDQLVVVIGSHTTTPVSS